jgi:hypothetical protein
MGHDGAASSEDGMNEPLDAVPAAIVRPPERVENGAGARRRWRTPRVIVASVEDDTASGIKPHNVETSPPFNDVLS